jgi:hypothetical protein
MSISLYYPVMTVKRQGERRERGRERKREREGERERENETCSKSLIGSPLLGSDYPPG